jgi:hypothetical protein
MEVVTSGETDRIDIDTPISSMIPSGPAVSLAARKLERRADEV